MDKLFSSNNFLRVIAVILSIILWLSVQFPNNTQTAVQPVTHIDKFPRPVHVETAANMVVTSVKPAVATLQVKESLLTTALSQQMLNVEILADAKKLGPGTHQVSVQAIHAPPINYQLNPTKITITLAKKATEQRTVKVVLKGSVKQGYKMGDPSSTVNTVSLIGATQKLRQVTKVEAVVQVNGASSDLSEQVDLVPVDNSGTTVQGVTVSPATATVNVPIQSPETTASIHPQIVGTPAPGYAVAGVSVQPNSVKLFGENAPVNVQLPVDVSGLTATSTKKIGIPLGQTIQQARPEEVSVKVTIEQASSKAVKKLPIQIRNVKSTEVVQLGKTTTVDLRLTGPQSVMNTLSTSNITAYIDASKLTPNDTSAPILINTPKWVQVTQMSTTSVPVTVTKG
ncbi:YbbR-like domain-containing protein [Alicyclobacillus sp. SO9]|uniref:CdaR family protein n=1 Tax=Alicyclobacillus sp. SO9 TaxID=2665646 RepID=UPI0018E78FE9|nr:CdaR family protein [Alicyclobacillus sp. SO9]QQE78490.1 hypothetical protein GI364_21890 [Alicyclobacillus sp. SO9]